MQDNTQPTYYIDTDNPLVRDFALAHAAGAETAREKAVKLYYAVRDGFRYNPYRFTMERDDYRASFVLSLGEGFCIQKAILLAAAARVVKIPCRLGFANVINHLSTKRLREALRTDLFVFHGYTLMNIDGNWVKATPAFDAELCARVGIHPLEFDGLADSIFHPLDREGRRHMEYVHDYGPFDDMPFEMMVREMRRYYPHLADFFDTSGIPADADFREEASRENTPGR
jgi:hypothetical protein